MAVLKKYDAEQFSLQKTYSDESSIREELSKIKVEYSVWPPAVHLKSGTLNQETILDHFAPQVSELKERYGFKVADVISMSPDHPQKTTLREKFLDEHVHDDHEARYFVDGKGLFYIHAQKSVYALFCEKGDLINVPKGTKHWFDMGENPKFTCIRVFTDEAGWVAKYTGSSIASHFPELTNTSS